MASRNVEHKGLGVVLEDVRNGLLQVNPADGSIWRVAKRYRSGEVRSVEPRRADTHRSAGWPVVTVSKDGRRYYASAHWVAYTVLVGPVPANASVRHRNGRVTDNRPANLVVAEGTGRQPDREAYARVVALHDAGGLTREQIAEQVGVCTKTVWRALRKAGRLSSRCGS